MDVDAAVGPEAEVGGVQRANDLEQLRLLSIAHYVAGGVAWVSAAVGLAFAVSLLPGVRAAQAYDGGGATGVATLVLLMMGGTALAAAAVGSALLRSGWLLPRRRQRTFCVLAAVLVSFAFPLGTLLGVFTIAVLQRPSVRALFDERASELDW